MTEGLRRPIKGNLIERMIRFYLSSAVVRPRMASPQYRYADGVIYRRDPSPYFTTFASMI